MKKQLEQSIKEILEQYNRIDTLYDNKRRFRYGKNNIPTFKNVENKRNGTDNRSGQYKIFRS